MRISTQITTALVVGSLAVAGCAPRPSAMQPVLFGTAEDAPGFGVALDDCAGRVEGAQAVARPGSPNLAEGAAAAGIGVAAGQAVAGGAAGDWGNFAVGATAILIAPALLLGLTAARRQAEERRIQREMEACLGEAGYEVAYWRRR